MANTKLGSLQKLSAELRLEIFQHALTTSECLRRPQDGEQWYKKTPHAQSTWLTRGSFPTDLLRANKQIHNDCVEILYKSHTFCLTPADIEDFGSAANFSSIERIVVLYDASRCPMDGPRAFAIETLSQIEAHTYRTEPRSVHLKSLIIPIDDFRPCYGESITKDAESGRADTTDIGLWTLSLGQTFQIDLVQCQIRHIWSQIQAASPDVTSETIDARVKAYAEQRKDNGYDKAALAEVLLHVVSIAIELKNPGAVLPLTPYLPLPAFGTLIDLCDKVSAQTVDVVFTMPSFLQLGVGSDKRALAWANRVLLDVLDALADADDDDSARAILG
ncbi:hypothetical protein LTR85_008981 [Meristemomyces frigidus]|nr:hypothetical protein LTR85_008981 [Meristemomyces frigidus]